EQNLHRLQIIYQKLRTELNLGEIKAELPETETQRILQTIINSIKESSEDEIVKTLMLTPMIRPLVDIEKWSEDSFKENLLQNMLPINIHDKFGNTIANYN